jgi:hypothetical protein
MGMIWKQTRARQEIALAGAGLLRLPFQVFIHLFLFMLKNKEPPVNK